MIDPSPYLNENLGTEILIFGVIIKVIGLLALGLLGWWIAALIHYLITYMREPKKINQEGVWMRCPHCEYVIHGMGLTLEAGKNYLATIDKKTGHIVIEHVKQEVETIRAKIYMIVNGNNQPIYNPKNRAAWIFFSEGDAQNHIEKTRRMAGGRKRRIVEFEVTFPVEL